MARKQFLKEPKPFTANMERALHIQATKRAFTLGISFSDYLSRLMVADLRRTSSTAPRTARRFDGGRAA